jgi:hypothetical protein
MISDDYKKISEEECRNILNKNFSIFQLYSGPHEDSELHKFYAPKNKIQSDFSKAIVDTIRYVFQELNIQGGLRVADLLHEDDLDEEEQYRNKKLEVFIKKMEEYDFYYIGKDYEVYIGNWDYLDYKDGKLVLGKFDYRLEQNINYDKDDIGYYFDKIVDSDDKDYFEDPFSDL